MTISRSDVCRLSEIVALRQHDMDGILATPRDYKQFAVNNNLLSNSDFRYRGFPAGNFESPRDPFTIPTRGPPASHDLNKSHGYKDWLDTKNPKIHGKVGSGMQYGSNQPLNGSRKTHGFSDPLKERTSAELRKYHQAQQEVEQDIKQYKEEKKLRMLAREDEKRKDMEMLNNYNPWGKPGGGAPKLRDHISQRNEYNTLKDMEEEYGSFHDNFGRPGAGAPLRSNSGKLQADLKTDLNIHFGLPEGSKMFDKEVKHRMPGVQRMRYNEDLALQVNEQRMQDQQAKIQDLRNEIETLKYDPYGKPGAGAPINRREPRKQYVNDDPELSPYDPWGKGVGAPQRDDMGEVKRYKFSDKELGIVTKDSDVQGTSLPVWESKGGAGAPVKTFSGNVKTRKVNTLGSSDRGDVIVQERNGVSKSDDPDLQGYFPFGAGRGGGGAPMRNEKGELRTSVYGNFNKHDSGDPRASQEAKRLYLQELEYEMQQQRDSRRSMENEIRQPGDDLASVMKKGQVGKPRRDPNTGLLQDQHRGISDVTKLRNSGSFNYGGSRSSSDYSEKTDYRKYANDNSNNYHTELERAAEERKQAQHLARVRDYEEDNHHSSTFDNYFGRPGGGAPKNDTKKPNLNNILHKPTDKTNNFYNKSMDMHRPDNYVRSTIPSNSTNMYEVTNAPSYGSEKASYDLMTPFASNPKEAAY